MARPPPVRGANAPSEVQAPTRLKSIVVRPPRAPTPPAGRRKTVWTRIELTNLATAVPMAQRTLPSKAPANQKGKAIYSASASCWERGESSGVNAQDGDPLSPNWQVSRKKHWWRKDPDLQAANSGKPRRMEEHPAPGHPMADQDGYKKHLAGRCFSCLGLDHQVAQCRDPIRCLQCRGIGHISKLCPSRRRRQQPISDKLRS